MSRARFKRSARSLATPYRPDLTLYGGARWLFAPRVGLTLRIGYPAFSAGFSFLL